MSISKEISQSAESQIKLPDKLNAVAAFLEKEYDFQVNFCKIYGKRWSYVAGNRDLEFAPQRRQLTPRFGIFYKQNDEINPDKMNEIFTALTQILTEIEND
ncbi:MAG TPA: hypothetical protein P5268_04895 [Candidatus Marinimicrobia bacterium]|nr:hypothetical protein [Candidatus Neomarinimicrobiota bacterium]HRS51566.1 hypothetical protein [Candidatus Neomarinimicrobiota bacterium]HRU92356.1 hypothetical protein [Candidatus Neomarinimicrobiota bacterium]